MFALVLRALPGKLRHRELRGLAQCRTALTKCQGWSWSAGVSAFLPLGCSWPGGRKRDSRKDSCAGGCEPLTRAPGGRGLGIWVRLGTAGSSQSNYCPTCLSAHIGEPKPGSGPQIRERGPQGPLATGTGGCRGAGCCQVGDLQGWGRGSGCEGLVAHRSMAWAGSSLSVATMQLPRGREQACDCMEVC